MLDATGCFCINSNNMSARIQMDILFVCNFFDISFLVIYFFIGLLATFSNM